MAKVLPCGEFWQNGEDENLLPKNGGHRVIGVVLHRLYNHTYSQPISSLNTLVLQSSKQQIEPMRTMKPKAKLKKNGSRFARMKLTSGEATSSSEPPDLSQLRKPIDISLSSLRQVVQLFDRGSDEVKAILTYECDVVYECRICRSLFRSLANFISHKRAYCLEKHNVTPSRRNTDHAETMYEDDTFPHSEVSLDTDNTINKANDRTLRSQNLRKEPRRDLTSVVDMLTKRQNEDSDYECTTEESRNNAPLHIVSDNQQVTLEVIDSKRAAYQTVLKKENSAANRTDLMMNQTLELKSMLNRNTGVLGPDGQLLEISDAGGNDSPWGEEETFEMNLKPKINREVSCTMCDAKFSTKKTMTFHVKTKHVPHRMCYPCPCCSGTFTNRWSVYRHLFKVHRKTNEQVRRLRSQIQARAFRRESLRIEKIPRESDTIKSESNGEERINEDTQNLIIAQEWMENLELDAELQRCGKCGKRFERKAALMSHQQICQKRGNNGNNEITGRHKRARKIPPQRVSDSVETRIAEGAENREKSAATISALSKQPIIKTKDWKITPKISILRSKSRSNLVNRKSNVSSIDRKVANNSILRKNNSSGVVGKIGSSTAVSNVPMEISIRVEDVSSLSKDMWDKIGTSDNDTDRDSSVQDSVRSSSICSPQRSSSCSDSTEMNKVASSSAVNPTIPEVIYTSIDNYVPVTLSVLGKEKKLGIQYRGVRLPTVTLEKIKVPRKHLDGSCEEPIVPTLEPIIPTLEPIVPTLEPIVPTLEPIVPTLEPIVPTLEPIVPIHEPIVPRHETSIPKLVPILPRPEPTVTRLEQPLPSLEPIVSSPDKNITVNSTNERTNIPNEKIRQPTQFRKLQCFPCNRRFMSLANLRRHTGVHTRRYRYRCKLCDDFKSLLKCDVVAHCNKKHNAKNNRSLLADLVIEVPIINDASQIDKTPVEPVNEMSNEQQQQQQQLEEAGSTDKHVTPVKMNIEREMTIDEVPKSSSSTEKQTLEIEEPKTTTSVASVPNLRPRRGRPPNSIRKGKRGREKNKKLLKKKKVVAKARIVRHVSPPRLPDDSSDEIEDIIRSTDELTETKSDEFSRARAPSRLDRDPELRKMVMEVIFGSSQKDTNDVDRQIDNDPETSGSINDESDKTVESGEKLESLIPREEQGIIGRTKILATTDKYDDAQIQPIIANPAGNSVFFQQYRNYELKHIAINRDSIVFPKNSNFVAIQVSTASPIVRLTNHLPSLTTSTGENRLIIREDDTANDDLTEAR